jgi:hypothetical protein
MPVDLYKSLAEKYNVVLACSNNSRNGPIQQSMIAGKAVLNDVFARLTINRKFILASGFSGGGRTAVGIAADTKLFAGVITCGAAFSSLNVITKENPVFFAEVIGRGDMNYQEALGAESHLTKQNNPHILVMFDGGHQWPPVAAYEEALAWHYLRVFNDEALARANYASQLKNAKVQLDSGYLYESSRMLMQMKRSFPQQELLLKTDSMLKILGANKNLMPQAKEVSRVDERERFIQKEMSRQYVQHIAYSASDTAFHREYWTKFRRDCDMMVKSGEKYKALAGARLIDFGWRMCVEQHYLYMEYDQFRQAAMAARIWALIQPEKPEPCIQAAKAYALQERKDGMMEYMKMAIARGLKDRQALLKDRAFAKFMQDEEFLTLMLR